MRPEGPLRILVLSYETPAYPGAGGPSRQHCLLEPLASRHSIRVLSTGGAPPFGALPRGVDVRLVEPGAEPGHPSEGWLRKNLTHNLGDQPWLHRQASGHRSALLAVLPHHLAEFSPDVVQVEHAELAPLLRALPSAQRSVLVLHNMITSVQLQRVRTANPVAALREALELQVVLRRERSDLRASTRVVTVTEADRRLAARLARHHRITVVPNCVDTAYFRRTSDPDPIPTAVMTASFHYPPNQHAARRLIDEVWPQVQARLPHARLVLVGQGMPDEIADLARAAGVEVTGAVDDVRPYLFRSQVAVAPLRLGSGSPLKVVEALAGRTPVVAARRVVRALGLGVGEGVVPADQPAEIVDRLVDLLGDPARAGELGAAGERVASRRFDRLTAATVLEGVWRQAVSDEG